MGLSVIDGPITTPGPHPQLNFGQELVQCAADFPGGGPISHPLIFAVARGDLVL